MDFRLFPKIKNVEATTAYRIVLQALWNATANAMSKFVNTWMLILNSGRGPTVESLVKEFFPLHRIRQDSKYMYCKDESTYSAKHKDKVIYLQRITKSFANSKLVDATGKVPKLSDEED